MKDKSTFGPVGIGFMMFGLFAVFISLYLMEVYIGGPDAGNPLKLSSIQLVEKLGLTLFAVGLIDLIIHLPALNRHFADGLRDLIIKDSYLKKLSPERLTEVVNRAFQAQAGDSGADIGKEGSFLQYFHSSIRGFITEPYRENASAEILCLNTKDENFFYIHDILSYACRKSGKSIQQKVRWSNDPDEIEEPKVKIVIQLPGHEDSIVLADQTKFKFKYKGVPELFDEEQDGMDLEYHLLEEPLNAYSDHDGLIVRIEAEYKVRKDHLQYWTMSHLTKWLNITLRYPCTLDLELIPFIQGSKGKPLITKNSGYYRASYNQWILPGEGFCWKFVERFREPVQHPELVEPKESPVAADAS
jgi:hypothetical protein